MASATEFILEVVDELLPEFRGAGLDVMALHKLQRDLKGRVELIRFTDFSGSYLKPEVADIIDEIDLSVRELEAKNTASKLDNAHSAPRKLNKLDLRTIDILEKADRSIKLDDLIRQVRPVITEDSYRRRLRDLHREGLVCRDFRGRYWHPGLKKTGH
jgi:hypothetical protein